MDSEDFKNNDGARSESASAEEDRREEPRERRRRGANVRSIRDFSPGAGYFDELLTVAEAQAIGDVGGEGDAEQPFDEEREIAAWRRWAREAEAKRGLERQARAGHGFQKNLGPARARHLADRLEMLWREVELESLGHRSRLDGPTERQAEFRDAVGVSSKPDEQSRARRLEAGLGQPFCLSCGAQLEGQSAALCRRCEAAERASTLWSTRSSDARGRTKPDLGHRGALPEKADEKDPIDAFAETVFQPQAEPAESPELKPKDRDPRDAVSAEGSWRRHFWFSVVLWASLGVAASVYDVDGQARPSKQGRVHETK